MSASLAVVHVSLETSFDPPARHDLDALVARSDRLSAVLAKFGGAWQKRAADEAELVAYEPWGDERPLDWAERLKAQIEEEVGLQASIGIGGSRFAARMGSKQAGPSGVLVWFPGYEERLLGSMPLEELDELRPREIARLRQEGLRTVGKVAELDAKRARQLLGRLPIEIADFARHAEDASEASVRGSLSRSIGTLCRRLERRLTRVGAGARGLELKLTFRDGLVRERYLLLPAPTQFHAELATEAGRLLRHLSRECRHPEPIVGMSLTATGLTPIEGQMLLFSAGKLREVSVHLGRRE